MTRTAIHTRFAQGARSPLAGKAAFVRQFLRNPGATASVVPSLRRLAKRMLEGIDFGRMRAVVEYGPGSGVFTRAVLERLPRGWLASEGGRGRFIAIEFSPDMAAVVREQYPGVVVEQESAENVERVCVQHGIVPGELDLVISGLGWASFPPELTTNILEATHRVLAPGGEIRTFAYHVGLLMPGAKHFRAESERLFAEVHMSRGVWANLPPAFVYQCRKARQK